LFEEYALGMKFLISDLPVEYILGTPFLSIIEPHGSCRCFSGEPGYFITLPRIEDYPPKRIELPFVLESHAQLAYCKKNMVVVDVWDDQRNIPVSHYMDDTTLWEVYKEHWIPNW